MLNLVKRIPFQGKLNKTLSTAFLLKAGLGIMVPHSSNQIMGNMNDVGPKSFNNCIGWKNGWWQLNGITLGIEAAYRIVLYEPIYFELSYKNAFSKLFNIPLYKGRGRQNLWMNEIIFSLGITLD